VRAVYNEIYDGLSAEIQSGLFFLYKKDAGSSDVMITGYGADLLFGGVLNTKSNPLEVNNLLWQQIYRTRWTGEFSSFGAMHYGIKIRHPFWNTRLIAFCLNLPSHFKVSNDVKVILREYAHQQSLLPAEIILRKKIGIHEGSSINILFSKILKSDSNDYVSKTSFTYDLYKKFISGESHIDHTDLYKIIHHNK